MNPLDQLPLLVPKLEPDDDVGIIDFRNSCFICLTDISISNNNDRERECVSSSVKILTSYILHNPLSSSSDDPEREELQRSILSSLSHGHSLICSECLSTAENLMEIHGKLEKIQKEIVSVLRDPQASLETGSTSQVQIVQNENMWLCRYRNMLAEKFASCGEREIQVRLERLTAAGFRISSLSPLYSLSKNPKNGSADSSQKKAIESSNIEHGIPDVKIEIDLTKMCFLCSNFDDMSSNRHHSNNPKTLNCIEILISCLLHYPSSSSINDNVGSEKEELQSNILSSLKDGKLLICTNCLHTAENLADLHLELDNLQIRILEILRNFQNYLKNSTGGGAVEMRDNVDVTLSISDFQDVLLQEFLSCEVSDGTKKHLGINSASSHNPPHENALGENPNERNARSNETPDIKVESDSTEDEWLPRESESDSEDSSSGSRKDEDKLFINENDHDDNDGEERRPDSVKSPEVPSKSKKKEAISSKSDQVSEYIESDVDKSVENGKDESGNDNDDLLSSRMDEYLETLENDGDPDPHYPSLWDCDICLEKVPKEELEGHLESHPEFEQYYQCEICFDSDSKRTYGTYKGLIWHYLRLEHTIQLPCKLCPEKDVQYYTRTDLCRHLYEHHYHHQLNHRRLPCKNEDCSEEFYDPRTRRLHHKLEHSGTAKCRYCKEKFKNRRILKEHMKESHELEERNRKMFLCSSCPKVYTTQAELKRHRQVQHEGIILERMKKVKCPKCFKTIQRHYLKKHLEFVHDEKSEEKLTCSECPRKFESQSRLDLHFERIHKDGGKATKFCCHSCPKIFSSKLGFQNHQASQHENPEQVVCPHCPKMFVKHGLYQHIRKVHKNNGGFLCKFCSKAFKLRSGKKRHEDEKICQSSESSKSSTRSRSSGSGFGEFLCQFCSRSIRGAVSNLENHERSCQSFVANFPAKSELVEGKMKYKCLKCDYVTERMTHMKTHILLHEERSLKCRFCDKTFRWKQSLGNHERTHTGEKPFKCQECDMMFTSQSGRSGHERTIHGIKRRDPVAQGDGVKPKRKRKKKATQSSESSEKNESERK